MKSLLAVLLALLALSACSDAEDVARDAASDAASKAACSVAEAAVGDLRGRVDGIARDLRDDPAAARRELTVVRESLTAVEQGVGGETRERVRQARTAVDDLLDQARAGTTVDDEAVRAARAEYDDAAAQLTDLC